MGVSCSLGLFGGSWVDYNSTTKIITRVGGLPLDFWDFEKNRAEFVLKIDGILAGVFLWCFI